MTVKELLIIMDKIKASDLYLTVDAPPMFRIEEPAAGATPPVIGSGGLIAWQTV